MAWGIIEECYERGLVSRHPSGYTDFVDRNDIQAYVSRDWDAIRAAKDDYWAARLRDGGTEPLLTVAESLRQLVRAVQPDWPRPEDREADFDHHVAVKRLLDRCRDVVPRG
jgi:hypothetical protein